MEGNLKEECGLVSMVNTDLQSIISALSHLQHRGRDSFGISFVTETGEKHTIKRVGLVDKQSNGIENQKVKMAIGHVRYSTTKGKDMNDRTVQPFDNEHLLGKFSLAHNGNVPNLREYAKKYNVTCGDNDTEFLSNLISGIEGKSWKEVLVKLLSMVKGVYCLVILTTTSIYIVKDRFGVRPLSIMKMDERYAVVSETCALKDVGYESISEVKAGGILELTDKGLNVLIEGSDPRQFCWFEYIYFMRAESELYGDTVEQYRYICGKKMGKQEDINFGSSTIVVAMPNTAIPSAKGYAKETGLQYQQVIEKIKGVGRTFILPTNKERIDACVKGLYFDPKEIIDKDVILIDDSIVRGNTLKAIVGRLREVGVKSVHARIMSPIVKSPCYYGIDIPTREELIGYTCNGNVEMIRKELKLDTLRYMKVEESGLVNVNVCTSCFTGKYLDILDW